MKIEIADLDFGKWKQWGKRPRCSKPGVYAIAITERELEGIDVQFRDIDYIGMSLNADGLWSRWNQFQATISGAYKLHSGASTVLSVENWKRYDEGSGKKIYVAFLAIDCDLKNPGPNDYRKMGEVAYLEFEAFARFCESRVNSNAAQSRRLPKYNKKGQGKPITMDDVQTPSSRDV